MCLAKSGTTRTDSIPFSPDHARFDPCKIELHTGKMSVCIPTHYDSSVICCSECIVYHYL